MGRASVLAFALAVAALGAAGVGARAGVTIFARPTTVAWAEGAMLSGTAPGARTDDVVAIQVKECGNPGFHPYAEAHANAGGGWSLPVGTGVTSAFRAVWRGTASAPVTIRQEAWVSLERHRSGSGFLVSVTSKRSLWRRVVEIQRSSGGAWRTVKRVRLTDSVTSTGTVSASRARFALSAPSGTRLRAVLPLEEAKPCYVRSVSRVVRA